MRWVIIFWGDQIILSLIQEKLKLNVIILSNTTTTVYPMEQI